ncbi:MAG: M13 family metallopeptidase [Crocinitomicaceae bacterium]
MKNKSIPLIILSGAILWACGTKKNTDTEVSTKKVDNNPFETIDVANMDKTVSPKEDFFLFADGTWCKNNPVPNSESRWGSFNELDKANKIKLTEILENAANNPSPLGSQNQIIGDYYKSFTDMYNRNEAGIQPIQLELGLINKMSSKIDLPTVLAELHKSGINAFFYFGVGQDMKHIDKNVANLYQGGIGLPNRDYYDKESKQEILSQYEGLIMNLLEMGNIRTTDIYKETQTILNVEKRLAKAMLTPSELRNPEKTYNKMGMNETKTLFGNFDFKKYLLGTGIESFDSLVIGQPAFISSVAKAYDELSLPEMKAYLNWCVINHYAGHLDENFVRRNFDFYGSILKGQKEMKPINERAIDEITGINIGELLGKAFVEKYYSANAQKRVNEMVDNLLVVFGDRIQNLSWMTPDTKREALTKLNSIGRKLGFPSKWENYKSIGVYKDSYIDNVRKVALFAHNKNMAELNKPVDKEEWGMPAHMVNAYYHPLLNEIAFPAGIMQPPFFSETYEDAVNYGRIGMVIGHEFTHGFDDMGAKFAADGSFTNWWTEQDLKSFEEKTAILGETFSNFCPTEKQCVNPELTMGENIADLGGLTLAYHAYTKTKEFQSNISREGYTPAQRFFIAYAQLWKINYTEAEMQNRLANDPHSPGMYRVNGPLKNCPEFFEAFEVKEGDKMRNPASKVAIIW